MGFRSWLRSLLCSPKTEKSEKRQPQPRPIIILIREEKMSNSQPLLIPQDPANSRESILSTAEMNITTVTEVAHRLGGLLPHIPHVVCGLAAMTYYGFTRRQPKSVTILCPLSSRRVLKCWAVAQGMYIFPSLPNVYGIKTSDGFVRRVNVRFVREFDETNIMKYGSAPSCVLSLAGIADDIATAYVKELMLSAGQKQSAYARDLFWIIEKIKLRQSRNHILTRQHAPHIYEDAFWVPFTLSFPASLNMFVKAGMDVDENGWPVAEQYEDEDSEVITIAFSSAPSSPSSISTKDSSDSMKAHIHKN